MSRPRKRGRDIDGVFLLDKPQGMSSNDIMQKVKRVFQANKAGHTGALDPLATGMLPICLGEATKFSQFLLDADKRYVVTAKLGERTDTSDAEGQLVETRPVNVETSQILTALEQFRGDILQVPTMFSALKHNGKPLYELVGEHVAKWGEDCVGSCGYSEVGAVVGATYPEMGKVLRNIMPKSYILVPGYGAQGGTADSLRPYFNEDGLGAIVNSSRGIICAYKQEKYASFGEKNYADASRQAVIDMIEDINRIF